MTVLKFITTMTKPFRWYLFGMLAAMCLVAADNNIKPYLIKTIINAAGQDDYSYIWIVVGIYAVSQVMMVAAWTLFDWCQSKYSPQLTSHIIKSMIEKINSYPYRFFQDHLSGDIMSKITNAAQQTPQAIDTVIVEMFQLFVTVIISVILLATVSIWFGLAILVWVSVYLLVLYLAMRKAGILSSKVAEAEAKTSGFLVDYLANMFSIKIFATHNFESKLLGINLNDYINKSRLKILYMKNFFTKQGLIYSCYIVGSLCGTIYLAQHNLITVGDFALIFMLNGEITMRMFHLGYLMNEFISNWGTIGQSITILDANPEILDAPDATSLQIKQAQIKFDNVHFSYPGTEPLFENKSVQIEHGSKVGLVGYSGGGKTTFVNLIMRLYDVTAGRVLIDNQDVRDVKQDSLRAAIAMIPQDSTLFHRSLIDNIRYGKTGASDTEVMHASKQAHAHEFISKLPQSYETQVGERGVKLSGGQRQRIAIARAFLKNAPILILDEATSQLDSITEQEIQDSLWNLMHDKTTLVIAHRLSTLLRMDRILVFDNGKIVEDGNHKELLAKHGLYKKLWDAQVGGFLPDGSIQEV